MMMAAIDHLLEADAERLYAADQRKHHANGTIMAATVPARKAAGKHHQHGDDDEGLRHARKGGVDGGADLIGLIGREIDHVVPIGSRPSYSRAVARSLPPCCVTS